MFDLQHQAVRANPATGRSLQGRVDRLGRIGTARQHRVQMQIGSQPQACRQSDGHPPRVFVKGRNLCQWHPLQHLRSMLLLRATHQRLVAHQLALDHVDDGLERERKRWAGDRGAMTDRQLLTRSRRGLR